SLDADRKRKDAVTFALLVVNRFVRWSAGKRSGAGACGVGARSVCCWRCWWAGWWLAGDVGFWVAVWYGYGGGGGCAGGGGCTVVDSALEGQLTHMLRNKVVASWIARGDHLRRVHDAQH